MPTTAQLAAIASFVTDLQNSACMGDRKDSVRRLASRIGAEEANRIAEAFGLKDSYYRA